MLINIVFSLLFSLVVVVVATINIPFINNAVFIPVSNSSSTIIINATCNQCLCFIFNSSFIALNCFPNNTCQFFNTYPRSYTTQSISQARLYFLQQISPNASQCCVTNTSYLLSRITATTPINATVFSPRCLVFDNYGYLVTISQINYTIVRLYPTNLSIVTQPVSPTFTTSPQTITYYNEAYYVGFNTYILMVDTTNLTILNNITAPFLSGTRGMMFLNNGQMMVVASTNNKTILFFNQSNTVSKSYNFISKQSVNYTYPHGLWYINETYFYLTSWGDNTIYTYSATNSSLIWTQNLFLNAKPIASTSGGNHLVIDECNRYWFMLGSNGIRIFNSQASLIANLTQIISFAFDAIITDNYVIYLSNTVSNQVMRIDPNIQCFSDQ